MRARPAAMAVLAAPAVLALAACGGGNAVALPGADAARGQQLITHYGCGSCHEISGIGQAYGHVGPSLKGYAQLRYITGSLPATPRTTARWIRHPQRYEPNTVMPALGITRSEARDITAYLYGQ